MKNAFITDNNNLILKFSFLLEYFLNNPKNRCVDRHINVQNQAEYAGRWTDEVSSKFSAYRCLCSCSISVMNKWGNDLNPLNKPPHYTNGKVFNRYAMCLSIRQSSKLVCPYWWPTACHWFSIRAFNLLWLSFWRIIIIIFYPTC